MHPGAREIAKPHQLDSRRMQSVERTALSTLIMGIVWSEGGLVSRGSGRRGGVRRALYDSECEESVGRVAFSVFGRVYRHIWR